MQLAFHHQRKKSHNRTVFFVTGFNSSTIIPAIIHIQNMMLLAQVGLGLTRRCSAGFSLSVEAHSEQQKVVLVYCSWVCGTKVSGLSGGLWRSCSS